MFLQGDQGWKLLRRDFADVAMPCSFLHIYPADLHKPKDSYLSLILDNTGS